jgi:acyl carrier protein
MNIDDIWAKLTEVYHEIFDDDEIELTPETTAEDIEEWDSLSNVQLLIAIEQEFGVKFSTGEIANLRNVGELVMVIQRQLGGGT